MLGPLRYPAPGAAHALGNPGSIPAIQARRVDGFKADISYTFQNTSLTCRSRVLQTDAPDIEPRMFTPFHLQMAALNVFFSSKLMLMRADCKHGPARSWGEQGSAGQSMSRIRICATQREGITFESTLPATDIPHFLLTRRIALLHLYDSNLTPRLCQHFDGVHCASGLFWPGNIQSHNISLYR
jgi:hypothetical protein